MLGNGVYKLGAERGINISALHVNSADPEASLKLHFSHSALQTGQRYQAIKKLGNHGLFTHMEKITDRISSILSFLPSTVFKLLAAAAAYLIANAVEEDMN